MSDRATPSDAQRRAEAIEREAAQWLIRREEAGWSPAEQAALDAWLGRAMAHKAAYWRLEHGWRQADRIAALGDGGEAAPARAARRTGLGPRFGRWLGGRRREPPRQGIAPWQGFALAAAMVAAIGGGVLLDRPPAPPIRITGHFHTAVGGRRLVPLVDGSRVELNTATSVRTAVTARHREVWLDQGEAYFEIAHRDGRPFVVHAGSRTVTVLGTKFSVRRDGEKVTVAVVEGRVRIDDAHRPDAVPTAIITAGDVAVARGPSTLLAAESEDEIHSALAWRGGMLDFQRTSLADAVREFNRYNPHAIAIGDAETGAIRIGGTFQATNVDAFVRLLHDAYGLRIAQSSAGFTISSR